MKTFEDYWEEEAYSRGRTPEAGAKEVAKKAWEAALNSKTESGAQVPCSGVLSTLSEILDICENTEELSGQYNSKEAMNCDTALTEIMDRCKEALKKDK